MLFKESLMSTIGKNSYGIKKLKCIGTLKRNNKVAAQLYDIIKVTNADPIELKRKLKIKIFFALIIGTKFPYPSKIGITQSVSSNIAVILKNDKKNLDLKEPILPDIIQTVLMKQKFLNKYFLK